MTGPRDAWGLAGGAALRGAGCAACVLLLADPPGAMLWWLIGCWLLYRAGTALHTAALAPTARALDRAARNRLLAAVRALGARSGHQNTERLRGHVYAAAGVAIRWEPKPGAAVAVVAGVADSVLLLAAVCAALATVDPVLAVGPALCAVLALGLAVRPRGLLARGRGTGRAGWYARRRETRTVTVLAWVLAAGAASSPVLGAAHSPGTAAGLWAAAILLVRFQYGMAVADLTAVHHWLVTHRHLREVDRAAAAGGRESRSNATTGLVVVPARPSRLGFADLAENVHLGVLGPEVSVPERLPRTVRVCRLDELAASLPYGWHTVLSAEFTGGVDLSDEAWDRITAARVGALLELGATEVSLPSKPEPALAAVLADWEVPLRAAHAGGAAS
ncbi:hypothetical protein [Streptomyces erythrochromogenes]|uniref:hypothetical protein n=1 Tax=Streptomyces erythrochromogenes TaxID=285574 RepID=UPI0033F2A6B0